MLNDTGTKSNARRISIGNKRPDRSPLLRELRSQGVLNSLFVAVGFFLLASAIMMLREDVVPFRPGQYVAHDIPSRVAFTFTDNDLLTQARQAARDSEPRVYKQNGEGWDDLQVALLDLPKQLSDKTLSEVPRNVRDALHLDTEPGALTAFNKLDKPDLRAQYDASVKTFIRDLSKLVVIPSNEYREEVDSVVRRQIKLAGSSYVPKSDLYPAAPDAVPNGQYAVLTEKIRDAARVFIGSPLQAKIVTFTVNTLKPTHSVDAAATTTAQNLEAEQIPRSKATVSYAANQLIVPKGIITDKAWQILKVEKEEYIKSLKGLAREAKLGLVGIVFVLTVILAGYIAYFQPRVVRNTTRSLAIAGLLLAMLLLAQLAAIGTGPLYVFGLAPTILVAMILSIAYDRRFAMGIAAMHGIMVTVALDQTVGFFLIIYAGVLTVAFLLDDIRSRSKLIEVGGMTAIAMIITAAAAGATSLDPVRFIAKNCLYTGAAGLAVGFVVLGILPFIEKLFKITTGMTLLELADSGQPLLRRLALEAPGTYNHSMQVAVLAEAAAEAIGGHSLLCRVAAFYHDVGKVNKPDYFIENQSGGPNKHLNLTPNVSFLIIHGHVKDGVAMAKEYNLPQQILPFIQQHHGTTLVEYFYHQACQQKDQKQPGTPAIAEDQFRYLGPKPKSKEIAILMLADTVESATRAMREPTAGSIENLVHELAMKRLLDGQFDESDLTMRDLEMVERSLIKSLQGIYHGRLAYPSSTKPPATTAPMLSAGGAGPRPA